MSEGDRKDRWDKAQVLATFFIGVVGAVFTFVLQHQQERDRRSQVATQLMSQREQSEMDFRGTMFRVLLEQLLNRGSPVEERVTILRLFQDNFHDAFNGRAFFDVLRKQAGDKPQVIDELNSLGREVSRLQEGIIEASAGRAFASVWLEENEKAAESISVGSRDREGRGHHVFVTVTKVEADSVRVRLRVDEETAEDEREFSVRYYDTPFTDNTLLEDGHRMALVLKGTDTATSPHRARLKVLEFPADYIVSGYRPSLGQVHKMLEEQGD